MELIQRKGVLSSSFDVRAKLSGVLSEVREELNDHLEAINENTNETQSNFEYLCELDSKIEKLNERIDQISLFLHRHGLQVEKKPDFTFQRLSKREQEVFLVLYTLDGGSDKITYSDLAKRTCLTEAIIMGYIDNMIRKGIPIVRKHIHNSTYLKLNPHFRNLQAKQNILCLNQSTLF